MKKFWILVAIFTFFIMPCNSNELADDYFDIANNYLEIGDSTKALEYINYVLMINPKHSQALELKYRLLPQESNDDLTRTAILLSKKNKISDLAILDIPKTDKFKVENTSEYYNKQGKQYYFNEEYDSAIQSFFRAIAIDNKNYIAYNNLGIAYWMKNDILSAEKYFKKAASIGKTYPQPYINLALIYKQKGDMDKHLAYLKKALDVNPNNYWTYYLIGDYYSSINNAPESIPYLTDAISLNPNFAPPYLSLGISYFKTDKYEKSILTLKKYIELNPNSDFAYSMLAKNYYILGDYAKAKIYIKTAIKLNHASTYRLELAKILYNAGEYYDSLLNFQIIESDYPYAETYNYIGLCNLGLKRFEMAIINFNKAIVLDNRRAIYYYNLAQCYEKLDEKSKYVQYMNTALQVTPVTYQDYIDLSCIYFNTGKTSLSISTLKNGISQNQNCKPLYLALLNIYDRLDDNVGYNSIKNEIEVRFNTNEKKKAFKFIQ